MSRCPRCGQECLATAKFCKKCGSPIQVKQEYNVCQYCKQPLFPGVKFCKNCGKEVGKIQVEKRVEIKVQHCIQCHKELVEGSKFCKYCGSSQEVVEIVSAGAVDVVVSNDMPKRNRCKTCGKELVEGSKFCKYCGSSQEVVEIVSAGAVDVVVSNDMPKRNRCKTCGKELVEGSKFCKYCGSSQEVVEIVSQQGDKVIISNTMPPLKNIVHSCKKCGKEITGNNKFCDDCQPTAKQRKLANPFKPKVEAVKETVSQQLNNAFLVQASNQPGEMVLDNYFVMGSAETLSTFKVLFSGITGMFSNIIDNVKQPKALLVALGTSALLFVASMFDLPPILSWLTNAQAGQYGGTIGIIGAIFGRGIMFSSIAMLFSGTFKNKELKLFDIKALNGNKKLIVLSFGIAMIISCFITGNGQRMNSVVCLFSSLAVVQSFKDPSSFLRQLVESITKNDKVQPFFVGLLLGFIVSIGLTYFNIPFLGYGIGLVLIVLSFFIK